MRIAVMTDAHANRPALEAALADIKLQGADVLFHTGDAIDLGPFPAETLDLLAGHNVKCVMGNHDAFFADRPQRPSRKLPPYRPPVETDAEAEHIAWTASRLTARHHHFVRHWPYSIEHTFSGHRLLFVHYALAIDAPQGFAEIAEPPEGGTLTATFAPTLADLPTKPDLVFFGHSHAATDLPPTAATGTRYLSPGPLGLGEEGAVARYLLITLTPGQVTVERRTPAYDDTDLARAWRTFGIPDRDLILREFYAGRYL